MAVIAEEGYAGASLRKVSQRAGFTTGAVTYYFQNKKMMVVAAAEHMFDEFDALLRPGYRIDDIKEAFELWLGRMSSDRELWLVQFQLIAHAAQEPAVAEVLERRYAIYRKNFSAIIQMYQDRGAVRRDIPADLLADQLSAIADGWAMMIPIEPQRFAPEHMDALLRSLMVTLTMPADNPQPAPA